jgi:hypothetical protein
MATRKLSRLRARVTRIKAGILANLLLAATLCVTWPRPVRTWRWGLFDVSLVLAAAVVFAPQWSQQLMTSGAAIYANAYSTGPGRKGLSDALRDRAVLFYRDGAIATVAVTRDGDTLSLRVNGKVDASNSIDDMPTQFMLGHLPLLIHPDPPAGCS